MKRKVLRITVALVAIILVLDLFNVSLSSEAKADEGLKNSAVQFLSNFYEIRSEAIVNSRKANTFLSEYLKESTKLKVHEANRINFYHNWIKQFNGTINEMHSHIYPIKYSFQINNNKASIEIYEWITIKWTMKKKKIDVNNLPAVKKLEELYKTTKNPLLKENLPYRIEELKKEAENTPTNITSGIGVYHTVVLLRKGNSWKILKDSYNEGFDLTKSPDFKESKKDCKVSTQPKPYLQAQTIHITEYYPQSSYNPDDALNYADYCVDPSSPDSVPYTNDDFYNLNYKNFNSSGGDCANYVSQCLYAGNERMVKDSSNLYNGWYYDNNDTGISDPSQYNSSCSWLNDDKHYSNSWIGVGSLKTFLISHNRGYEYSTLSYAVRGDVLENAKSNVPEYQWHTMIVRSNPSGDLIFVDGHNNDRYNCPYSESTLESNRDYCNYSYIGMYHEYPLELSNSENFFYPLNFPVIRRIDCN